ncbi:hypothetical protein JOS77_23745 [Chromobacterium haemolyticum]|nr:hypothetical protein JOS77_23745 [Chromobacterium haemolyticum]
MAWVRCLNEVQNNQIDGVFEISFKPERLRIGVYPMKGDVPDPNLRMHLDGYSLYRLKGSKLEWDGQSLSHLDGAVGAQTGFSVIAQLQALGAPVDDSSRNPEQNLNKLLAHRIGALALPTLTGDNLLASNPVYRDRVEKVGPDLVAKPYYLIFSHNFADSHPKLTPPILGSHRPNAGIPRIPQSPARRAAPTQPLTPPCCVSAIPNRQSAARPLAPPRESCERKPGLRLTPPGET